MSVGGKAESGRSSNLVHFSFLIPLIILALPAKCQVVGWVLTDVTSNDPAPWNVHATFLHWESLTPKGMMNLLIGVEHELTDRGGWSVDANLGINADKIFASRSNPRTHDLTRWNIGLTYHTYYMITTGSRWPLYAGPFAGIRRIHSNLKINDRYSYPVSETRWNKWAFPVGIRCGFRGAWSKLFGDLYFGVGYQLGNNEPEIVDLIDKGEQLSHLFLQAGMVYGLVWDRADR